MYYFNFLKADDTQDLTTKSTYMKKVTSDNNEVEQNGTKACHLRTKHHHSVFLRGPCTEKNIIKSDADFHT